MRADVPGWDEPAFRATYPLTVTLPAAWKAVSNMPVQTRSVHGARRRPRSSTPKMPSYLVVFTAGDLASIAGVGSDGVKQSVWAIKGDEQTAGTRSRARRRSCRTTTTSSA